MENVSIKCSLVEQNFFLQPDKKVQISIVAYEHPVGMPARFCAGLFPAIALSRKIELNAIKTIVRLIDPTPIANYCNGWEMRQSQFRDVITKFLSDHNVSLFFDEAEQVDEGTLEILTSLGNELESATDEKVVDMVGRIKESGRKHGGKSGARNSVLYMAAHPFSWLDMYHPLIWKKEYSPECLQFVNLMSKPESRFTVVRKFLQERRPDLCTKFNPVDQYMTVCNTPCYIPLEEEPRFADLVNNGYDWCFKRYQGLKGKSSNHNRAYKDFGALMSFLGLGST